MAEAFHEDLNISEHPDDSRAISVLLLGTRWQFDTYGFSTVNKSLVNNLRLVGPEAQTIKIICAVVEEEGKIKDEDLKDASKDGVDLKGAKRPRGSKRRKKPKLQWLDKSPATYYRHLVKDQKYDFIIGHAPYLANGCLNFKDLCKDKNESPKTVLVFHSLPKDEDGDVDDDMLLDWLKETDVLFSLGTAVENELLPYISSLEAEKRPIHKLYFPLYPVELFAAKQDNRGKVRGTQNVSVMSGEMKHMNINGLDFPLAVTAAAGASKHLREFNGIRINLPLLAANEDEKGEWKKTFEKVLKSKNLTETGLSFKAEAPLNIDQIVVQMKMSNLFLLPLKQNSPLFGTEALAAIAAGVPVLVSRYSGIASLLHEIQQDGPVIFYNEIEGNAKIWKERIIQKLIKPDEARQRANRLREQLLLDTGIAQTHLDFISIITFTIRSFITARKRSLGEGNIFTSVCHSFCPQEEELAYQYASQVTGPGVSASRGSASREGLPPGGFASGGSASKGDCLWDVCIQGGMHLGGLPPGGEQTPLDTMRYGQ